MLEDMNSPFSSNLLRLLGLKTLPNVKPWVVRESGFLKGLSDQDAQLIGEICPPRPYRRGEAIYRKGDEAENLYVLLEGNIKIAQPKLLGGEKVVTICGPDDFFGESFLTGQQMRSSDAVCLSDQALTCPISRAQFLEVSRKVPTVAVLFCSVLAARNEELQDKLEQLAQPAPLRLARTLQSLALRLGEQQSGALYRLKVDFRHEDLASMANTSRVSASYAASQWRKEGVLSGVRGDYLVDLTKLQDHLETLEEQHLE